MTAFESILVTREGAVAHLQLNRPERMNAVIGTAEENSTVVKVGEYMRAADDDPRVRVIVLTGVGRAFCAGVDVRGDIPAEVIGERLVGNRNAEDTAEGTRQNFIHGLTKVMRDISQVRKPTIAMINGPAVGSGAGRSGLTGASWTGWRRGRPWPEARRWPAGGAAPSWGPDRCRPPWDPRG